MKRILYTLSLSIFAVAVTAQNVEFKSANFKDDKDGLNKAIDNIKLGDEALELGNEAIIAVTDPGDYFEQALFYYLQANDFNPSNAELNFKIGNAYLYTHDKVKALEHLEKALELNPDSDPDIYYYLGQAYHINEDLNEAETAYKKFKSTAKSKLFEAFESWVNKYLNEIESAREHMGNPERVWVDNLSEINTENSEMGPCISTDGELLTFCSDRPNDNSANDYGNYDFDIYMTTWDGEAWGTVSSAGEFVNSGEDDISSALSYDGTKMLMYKSTDGQTDIFECELSGLTWGGPRNFHKSINTAENQSNASYNFDGFRLYYVTDQKTGSNIGGYDIYFAGLQDPHNDFWAKGVSASRTVNTKYNEGSVFMTPDGNTMYFSSQGHNSIGGYDIFVVRQDQGEWKEIENLGYPVNSTGDDIVIGITANGKYAYIASNRAGGEGGMDIYKVTFWGPPKQFLVDAEDYLLASIAEPVKDVQIAESAEVNRNSLTVFKGKTIDHLTEEPVEADIEITDLGTGEVINTVTTNSATGKFLISLPAGKNYAITVKADGYLFHSENFDLPDDSDYNLVDKTIYLKNIAVGSKIALRNVFFETGKADIKSESNAELNRLVDLLKDVPSLKIELSGHTDDQGSDSFNLTLSQDRAEAVMNWLIAKGIDAGRLSAKGYGETVPLASNATAAGRQENRRTEFLITAN